MILDLTDAEPVSFGGFSLYYVTPDGKGVKVVLGYLAADNHNGLFADADFPLPESPQGLYDLHLWTKAQDEYRDLAMCQHIPNVPRLYSLTVAKISDTLDGVVDLNGFAPAIVMEHIDALEIEQVVHDIVERNNMKNRVYQDLEDLGLRHKDLGGNILAQKDTRSGDLKWWVIDFSPGYVEVERELAT